MSRVGRTLRAVCALALAAAASLLLGCSAAANSTSTAAPAAASAPAGRPASLLAKTDSTVLAVDAGIAGDRVSGLLELPADACAVLIARAGESVDDVDLFAYGEDGTVVGSDEGPDKTPALLVCPPHPRRIWVTARIAAGHGLVALGSQRVAPIDAKRAAALYGTKSGSAALAARAGAWPGIDDRLTQHRREIGAAWQDVRRVGVPLDSKVPTRVSARVDAERCLDAYVFPSDEAGHLELLALDANGAIVGRSQNAGRERFIVVCAPTDTEIAFEIRPQSGRGFGVLILSRTRPGSERDLDTSAAHVEAYPTADLAAELRKVDAALTRDGYTPSKTVASGVLDIGRRASVPMNLPAGCSRVDVVGGSPLRGIEARVWSARGALLSRAEQGGQALLFVCGPAAPVRLDVEATLRGGPYAVRVQSETDVHPALVATPLTAGRLLARVVERGVLRRASEIGQVREVMLSADEVQTLELTVPFGRCVDVALALNADTVGAEVRLVAASGVQIGLARGPHATSARACSLDAESAQANLKTRAELRVAAGSGKGLVSTRMLAPPR